MKKLLLLLTVFLFTSLVFAGKVVTKKDSLLQVSGTDSIWQIAKGTSAQFVTDKGTFRFNKIITIAGDTVITYSTLEDSLGAYVDTLTNQNIYGDKVFYGTVIAPSIKMTTLYNDSGLTLISNENTKTTFSRGDTTFITMADTTIRAQKNLVAPKFYVSALNEAPASAAAEGTTGEIRITADYIYVCVSDDVWVRSALVTWP